MKFFIINSFRLMIYIAYIFVLLVGFAAPDVSSTMRSQRSSSVRICWASLIRQSPSHVGPTKSQAPPEFAGPVE